MGWFSFPGGLGVHQPEGRAACLCCLCESRGDPPEKAPHRCVCVLATPGPSRRSIACDPSVFPPSTPAGRLNAILTFISISPLAESLGGDGPGGRGTWTSPAT